MKLCNVNSESVLFIGYKVQPDRWHTIHTEGQALSFFDPSEPPVNIIYKHPVSASQKTQLICIIKSKPANKHCWLCQLYWTRKYTEFAKCGHFSGKCGYHCTVKSLFRSARGSCSLRDTKNSSNEAIPMFRAVQITISVLFWESSR